MAGSSGKKTSNEQKIVTRESISSEESPNEEDENAIETIESQPLDSWPTAKNSSQNDHHQKKIPSTTLKSIRTNKHKHRNELFSFYIYKVFRQLFDKEISISSKAILIMNSFIDDMFERISTEASVLCKYNKKQTLTSREIQTAVNLIMPGELATHAIAESVKALKKYNQNKN
ncbi:uncharacterized protein NH340_JMT03524 [Sarcoptes scabiei]|nr:uncharacterized protein NH340_JMT03524 [Sarcoptes scabiei]